MSAELLEVLPEDVLIGRAITPEMVRDLRVIAQFDARTVGFIAGHFSQLQGLALDESVKEGVQSCVQGSVVDLADDSARTSLNLKPSHEESNFGWMTSPEQLLDRLESPATTENDRITAVLFAEIIPFDPMQKPRWLRALIEFCEQHRFSREDDITTAVGSAIRKFAMNMPASEFESYSRLFLPTATDTLSCEIELELAKAVSWRLANVTSSKAGEYPDLEARLSELASDYLTARLILQENYASIVVHAVIAVGLLNGVRQDELIDRIANLHIDWFSELMARRLLAVVRKRQPAASEDDDNLTRLCKRLTANR